MCFFRTVDTPFFTFSSLFKKITDPSLFRREGKVKKQKKQKKTKKQKKVLLRITILFNLSKIGDGNTYLIDLMRKM